MSILAHATIDGSTASACAILRETSTSSSEEAAGSIHIGPRYSLRAAGRSLPRYWSWAILPRLRQRSHPHCCAKSTWTHEEGGCIILDYLLQSNGINLADYGLGPDEDVAFIKELILGVKDTERRRRDSAENRWPRQRFLYDIINNGESGLDVDRMDYYRRDCYYAGLQGRWCMIPCSIRAWSSSAWMGSNAFAFQKNCTTQCITFSVPDLSCTRQCTSTES